MINVNSFLKYEVCCIKVVLDEVCEISSCVDIRIRSWGFMFFEENKME